MIRDFLRSLPPGLVITVLALGFALGCIGAIAALRAVGRRFGTPAATIQIPAWLILGLTGGLVGVTLLLGHEPLLLFPGYLAVALPLTIGYSRYRRRSSPFRAIRQMNAGDHASAVAELRARIDRQRLALGLVAEPGVTAADSAPAVGPDDFNPYAAPSVSTSTLADRIQLASDLNTLGVVESNRGEWAPALLAYEEAETIGAGAIGPILRGNRGYALIELGRADEGLPLLRAAIDELHPADRWVRAQFLTGLGAKLLDLGHLEEVGALLDRARKEGRRESVYPRSGKKAWLARLDHLRARLAAAETAAPSQT